MRRIVFFVPQLSQPRSIKRIETIIQQHPDYLVYGFDRNLYNCNLSSIRFIVTKLFPTKKNRNKIVRILKYTLSIKSVLRDLKKDDVVFCFGIYMGIMVNFFSNNDYIYEEGDLKSARFSNPFLKCIFKMIEKILINKSKITVLTSNGFIDYLFKNEGKPRNVIIIPNKMNSCYLNEDRKCAFNLNTKKIRFAFIGFIRYPNILLRYINIIGSHFPMHEFHLWGDGAFIDVLRKEIEKYDNVYFHGQFRSPGDLSSIYSKIDINIVCYDAKCGNVNIAEPNKLYESIFFYKPIIVSKGTYLAKRVKELGVGFDLDCSNDISVIKFIEDISNLNFSNCIDNMKKISSTDLIDNEYELLKMMQTL
jgi:glycosyltransferase involved in cell wall biosynthesis